MKLCLDPWEAEYNTAHVAEEAVSEHPNIETDVEYKNWQAVTPTSNFDKIPYNQLLFVDGSRRIEARVLLEDKNRQVAFGALGSYGVGVVSCCPQGLSKANFLKWQIKRICTLSGGHSIDDFELKQTLNKCLGELHYEVISSEERDVDAVLRKLQFEMLNAERLLTSSLVDDYPNALIINDGPRPRLGFEPNVIGYLKTSHSIPIGPKKIMLIRELEQGQRSPLYLVKGQDPTQDYFEWFLRLRDPNPWLYSLAGMVRLQAAAGKEPQKRLDSVCQLANWLAIKLGNFSSKQHQDPRAPQQLLPIRALETELRRHMGSLQIIRRRITTYLSQQSFE